MIASLGELLLNSSLFFPRAKKGVTPQNSERFCCCPCDRGVVFHGSSFCGVSRPTSSLQYPFPTRTQLKYARLRGVQPPRFACPGIVRAVVLAAHDRFHFAPLPDNINPCDGRLKFPLRKMGDEENQSLRTGQPRRVFLHEWAHSGTEVDRRRTIWFVRSVKHVNWVYGSPVLRLKHHCPFHNCPVVHNDRNGCSHNYPLCVGVFVCSFRATLDALSSQLSIAD